MNLTNSTVFNANYSTGYAKDGRNVLIVIVKATYQIIPENSELIIHTEQQPIIQADVSTGKPGYSAVIYETDFSTYKPFCDVLLNGYAHIPHGEISTQVDVSMKIKGYINKSFRVKGHRTWKHPRPAKFNKMSISYDNAFGGIDSTDLVKLKIYMPNPVGTGYSYHKKNISDLALPNTEEIGDSITRPDGKYTPMSYGPIGRAWPSRVGYAGTYDQKWIENTMPFYPEDFDYRYFQCAPPEQQMPHIKGGEEVNLVNLSKYGHLSFTLPEQNIPVTVIFKKGTSVQYQSVVDTVIFEPEYERVIMVSRAMIPLSNDIHDVSEIIVGQLARQQFHKERTPSKYFYQNLSEYVSAYNIKNKKGK